MPQCTYESDKFRVPPRLMLWDFGVRGNDALTLTMSFFITERTLYLLVFKMTDCTQLHHSLHAADQVR